MSHVTRAARRLVLAAPIALALLAPASASAAGALTIDPAEVDFGAQAVGTSAERSVSVRNLGPDPVLLTDVYLVGDVDPFDFAGGTCSDVDPIAAGAECQLTLKFAPAAAGAYEVFLAAEGGPDDEPGVARLTGSGRQGSGSLVVEPGALAFPPTPKGSVSARQTLRVRNVGDGPATGVAVRGANPMYDVVNGCPSTLEAGAECSVSVAFAPRDPWTHMTSSSLRVHWDNQFGVVVPLSGSVTRPLAPTDPGALIEQNLARLSDALPALLRGGPRSARLPAFEAPAPGKLKLRAHVRTAKGRVLVATGDKRLTAGSEQRLRVRLTKRGRKLLKRPRATRVKVVVSFTADDGSVSKQSPEIVVKAPKVKRPAKRG